ncbi:hypothetical protein DS742_19380 [Lacrimispora amygdalina]|uniref:Uncharacterized protein n=1 Tax=Lacrimispora amygdalina TaxID=253257 RepID=A0A3E2N8Y8_9FIRM|nr:hypothetical protein [Clostridium indicum]RFZ77351.1 hypothetical protein DS742_19380 [Clostridium indicum]
MISSKSEYEDFVVKLLNSIISGEKLTPDLFPKYSEKDFLEVLSQCVTDGLVIGYSMSRVASGDPVGQRTGEPYVTIKGLSYIDSISQAKALDIAKAAESQSIIATLRANIATIASFTAILVSVLANLDRIVHNVQRVLSYLNTP